MRKKVNGVDARIEARFRNLTCGRSSVQHRNSGFDTSFDNDKLLFNREVSQV